MTNDNDTVASIVKRVRRECSSLPLPNAAGEKLKLVREINDAHKREIAEKDAEIARIKSVLSELFKRSLPKCTTCDCVCDECFECSLSDLVPLIKWSLEGVQFDPNDYSNLPLFKKEVTK